MLNQAVKDASPLEASERSPLLGSGQDRKASTASANATDNIEPQPDKVDDEFEPQYSTKKLSVILGSVWIGCFLNAIDSTIIATLAAPISNEFNSLKMLSWLATSYLIARTVSTPLSGKLTDIYGRRAGLIFCNIFFGVGTLICGLARSEWVIIVGRIIAGIGGGGMNSISTFIASDMVPLRQRGLWQGMSNICWGVGASLGGIYGGWMNDVWDWRWAFLIQVPMIAVSLVIVSFTVKSHASDEKKITKLKRVDFLGSLLLVAALASMQLGLNTGGNILPWSHPFVLTSLIASFVLLAGFVYAEEHFATEPIIPMHLVMNRTVFAACLTNCFDTMVEYALHYYGPLYFQVCGFSATKAGSLLIPQAVGVAFGSIGSGYIMRVTGRYWLLSAILEAMKLAATVMILLTFDDTSPSWPPYVYYFVCGFAYAGMLTTALIALTSGVDFKDQVLATSASYAFRAMGSTIGITISGAIFQALLNLRLWDRFGNLPGGPEEIGRIRDSIKEITLLPDGWKDGVIDSYLEAMRGVWIALVVFSLLGFASSLLMREHKLHKNLSRT